MIIARTEDELRRAVEAWRAAGERIGFVPTMGALHAGHLSLVRLARERSDRGNTSEKMVVASVFVNPAQFGPHDDFNRYPRQPERDAAVLAEAGCDLLFLPDVATIYPPGNATFLEPGGAAEGLEGACRPGHFRGVATVVCALFNLVRADLAVFGEKDAQQLAVVRQMVRDLHIPIEIAPARRSARRTVSPCPPATPTYRRRSGRRRRCSTAPSAPPRPRPPGASAGATPSAGGCGRCWTRSPWRGSSTPRWWTRKRFSRSRP